MTRDHPGDAADHPPALLKQATVLMTVFAQDPSVLSGQYPVLARIPVPAQRLQAGPRGYRFHVVDVGVVTAESVAPVILHDREHDWAFADRLAEVDPLSLSTDPDFLAQNVFAVASCTLALFERHLGRPIPWKSGDHQLFLVPRARREANATYSPEHNAVFFGWLPALGLRPALYTALCYDVIAHEVTHAILDGLRPRYAAASLPDQLAFHEALADLVALLSVFTLPGVAESLLRTDPQLGRPSLTRGVRLFFPGDERVAAGKRSGAAGTADQSEREARLTAARAEDLKRSPLLRLAEQVGARRRRPGQDDGMPSALRTSVLMVPNRQWQTDPDFEKPHRRAEILVAAFLQTQVSMWASRLIDFNPRGGMDPARVAEEGVKAAEHLLGMLLRSLDYLPPVELEFADVIDAVLAADQSLAPDDNHHYREALTASMAAFGIEPPEHHILDEDAMMAPRGRKEGPPSPFGADLDAIDTPRLRYEHLNMTALRTSPEEVYEFIWTNAARLGIDVRFATRVDRVITSTRVGPDGLVITEIIADYIQTLRGAAEDLPSELPRPDGLGSEDVVGLWGGGVLVFDQFGRFRMHQLKPITDMERQGRRLAYLVSQGIRDPDGSYGVSDGLVGTDSLALLHRSEGR